MPSKSLNSPRSRPAPQVSGPADLVPEFEALYRANVTALTAYFARRSADPQTVADLTADTFAQAITSFATFDPRKGTPRAWVFGIARRIYAAHCQAHSQQRSGVERLAGRRELAPDEIGELIDRIDAERPGRALVSELTTLPAADRAVVELVDLAGLQPKEAAQVLGVAPGTLRMRLMRGRARLRKAARRAMRTRVVVVPVQSGCPAIGSLPRPRPAPHPAVSVGTGVNGNGHRSVSVKVKGGIPKGDTMILAFSHGPGRDSLGAGGIITGPVPYCVSLPSAP